MSLAPVRVNWGISADRAFAAARRFGRAMNRQTVRLGPAHRATYLVALDRAKPRHRAGLHVREDA